MIIEIEKNYEKLAMFLEHKGFSDDEIDKYFLEHYGVSGMKWGVRRAQAINVRRAARGKAPVKASQYVGNKATRGAAYTVALLAGNSAGGIIGKFVGGSVGSTPGAAIGQTAGGIAGIVAGVKATNAILTNIGRKRMAELD